MKKKFDAVEFQRQVREKLSEEYNSNPEAFMRQLKETYREWKKKNKGAARKRCSA